ncbi:MAG TPA: helix-turn-helix domain-containing protein [Caldimonas sp.]|nr:helix-turn-helix domain-containing protein [Caldimonas sp.]
MKSTHGSLDPSLFRPLHAARCQVRCSSCNLREICLPVGLTREELGRIEHRLVAAQRKVARGTTLFRAGDRADALFAVRTGFFKTFVRSHQGEEQITGFQMAGELIGLSGIDSGVQQVDAVALEDSQVCVVPLADLEALEREAPSLQVRFHRVMSHEIAASHQAMLQLGSMHAEERVAAFLLNLMHRLAARGFSATSLVLRMSRDEIGSFLGLTPETVSRTLSGFQASGLLVVRQRLIEVTDATGLQRVLDGAPA